MLLHYINIWCYININIWCVYDVYACVREESLFKRNNSLLNYMSVITFISDFWAFPLGPPAIFQAILISKIQVKFTTCKKFTFKSYKHWIAYQHLFTKLEEYSLWSEYNANAFVETFLLSSDVNVDLYKMLNYNKIIHTHQNHIVHIDLCWNIERYIWLVTEWVHFSSVLGEK